MKKTLKKLYDFCKEHEKTCHEVAETLTEYGEDDSAWFTSGQGCAYGTVAMNIKQMINQIEKEEKEV